MEHQNETWKDIEGYEGLYQISNHGRLKSFLKDKSGKILSNVNKNGWYFTVRLLKDGKYNTTRIHKLVAEAFIPNPQSKREVHHIDGNKQNNHVDNLMWVTSKEHVAIEMQENPAFTDAMNIYNRYERPKPVTQYTLEGKYVTTYANCIEASERTGVCSRNINQVAAKTEYKPGLTRKQAGGFRWVFEGRKCNAN